MFADAEEVDADLFCEDALFDDVPDRLGVREWAVVLVVGEIAEYIEAEDEWEVRRLVFLGEGSDNL
jgi:hypothetical protein